MAGARKNFWFHSYLNSRWNLLVVLLPWLVFSPSLWVFTPQTAVFPLQPETFEITFKALQNHRLILPSAWMYFILPIFSFLSPMLLFLWSLLLTALLPGPKKFRVGAALAFSLSVYYLGAPHMTPDRAFQLLFFTVIVSPLLRPLPPLVLWLFGSIAVFFSFVFKDYAFLFLWMAASLLAGHITTFLFAEKTAPNRYERMHPLESFFKRTGFFLFLTWMIFSLVGFSFSNEIGPSPYWWLAWIVGFLCAGITWFNPWQLSRWLAPALFAQGLLFSDTLFWPVLVIGSWCLIKLLLECIQRWEFAQKLSPTVLQAGLASFATILVLLPTIHILISEDERRLSPAWTSVLQKIKKDDSRGFLIVGDALPFLANFHPASFVTDDSVLLEPSEQRLLEYMNQRNIDSAVIDTLHLKNLWKKWIAEGLEPEKINQSVISRLVLYQGKELDTYTLKLDPLKYYKAVPLDKHYNFIALKKINGPEVRTD